jgi:predicted phage gp36 major capsid-like protein
MTRQSVATLRGGTEPSAKKSDLVAPGSGAQDLSPREKGRSETTAPILSTEERSLVSELVADGLSIQGKFRPEPLYKQTGKGHYQAKTVEAIQKAKKGKGRPRYGPGGNDCSLPKK